MVDRFPMPGVTGIADVAGGTGNVAEVNAQGQLAVDTEGRKRTYSVAVSAYAPYATATDILTITGAPGVVVKVLRVEVSGRATAAAQLDAQVVLRSAANTGGTSAALTAASHDQSDAAPVAAVVTWTTAPTPGATAGIIRAAQVNISAAGSGGAAVPQDWDFTTRNGKAPTLRGSTQQLAINLNGAAVPAGTALDLSIEWTEENLTGE